MATKIWGGRARTPRIGAVAILALGLVLGGCKKTESSGTTSGESPAPPTPPPPAKTADKKAPPPTPTAPPPSTAPAPKAGGAPAEGMERFTDKAADNQIDVPKDWIHQPIGDHLLIQSPDKNVFIELSASLAIGKDKAAEKKLDSKIGKTLQNIKHVGAGAPAAQNGLTGWMHKGTGTKDKKPVDWESFALEDTAGKGAFGIVYATTADLASHRAVIDKILGSISVVTQ